MDYYVDIDMRSDPEFPINQLIAAAYTKLHRALVISGNSDVGVSFPGVDTQAPHFGKRLRLHSNFAVLSTLLGGEWLNGMRDHIVLTPPLPAPETTQHRIVRRVQVKSSPERLRRRLMRRHDLDEQTARQRIPDTAARFTALPFMQLRSTSTGQSFRLFIEHGAIQQEAVAGDFNAYGLSQSATVPWF